MLTEVNKLLPKERNGRTEGTECAKFPRNGKHGENEILKDGIYSSSTLTNNQCIYPSSPLMHNQCYLYARHCSWYLGHKSDHTGKNSSIMKPHINGKQKMTNNVLYHKHPTKQLRRLSRGEELLHSMKGGCNDGASPAG